jgi:hypothetical protein
LAGSSGFFNNIKIMQMEMLNVEVMMHVEAVGDDRNVIFLTVQARYMV